ncbi:DUF397 domain-containing protein [Streptomyces sp. NPDC088725]|uniref:DUF397 domain-containing protein n=1 Tax=Streptomyces sp. NPDC088725 TaxID=3365873 RepID=UPI00380283F0
MSHTPKLTRWVKSTHSGEGNCVEWSPSFVAAHSVVPVRDSKSVDGPVLMLTREAFVGLVAFARCADV